jgi:hypothetical protein
LGPLAKRADNAIDGRCRTTKNACVKRFLGVLVAVAALAGAAASARQVDADRLAAARADADRSASSAQQQARDALQLQLRSLEGRAAAAATLQPLIGILAQLRQVPLDGQLAKTLDNWFKDEPHWTPFRNEMPVYGVSAEGKRLGLLHGLPQAFAAMPGTQALVAKARQSGLASEILPAADRPHLTAAARVTVADLGEAPVLLVARPCDQGVLEELSERAGGAAVALTDGKRLLIGGGPKAELDQLAALIGSEATSTRAGDAEGTWAAAVGSLGPYLWLWTRAHTTGGAGGGPAMRTKAIVWGAAVLIAILSCVFGFRRPAQPGEPPDVVGGRVTGQRMERAPSAMQAAVAPPIRASATDMAAGSTLHAAGGIAAARPIPPSVFGRYTLVERLGEGGMAQVFTAVIFGAQGFRRKFVVKRMRPELVNDQNVVAQFIDEANLASSLIHSNIIPVLDFGQVGDEYFLATEYILGRDLGRVTLASQEREQRSLPVSLVLRVAHETLKALDYAHTKTGDAGRPLGIVHRDVSPNNILLSANGEVKLFDFGIVKAEGRVTKTQHGVVKGNVSFMSPEQARGLDTDARADLFSLGLVMFYCLTGEVLYAGNTTFELLVKAAGGPGPEELARIAALPAPASGLITRALKVDPADRFQTALAFAAAIAPHLSRDTSELGALMDRLFRGDFQAEERRFSAAVPVVGGDVQAGGKPQGAPSSAGGPRT